MSDRHEKWVPVAPGHVIPAGQPYRVEYDENYAEEDSVNKVLEVPRSSKGTWFLDSSWRPPLELPTEPTWGLMREAKFGTWLSPMCWKPNPDVPDQWITEPRVARLDRRNVAVFIPLTDEQVARIKAAL